MVVNLYKSCCSNRDRAIVLRKMALDRALDAIKDNHTDYIRGLSDTELERIINKHDEDGR